MATKPETKSTEAKVYAQERIGEFMTTWKDFPRPGLAAWAERRKAGLMGTASMRIRTYNMKDEQFAFHRALWSEASLLHPQQRSAPRVTPAVRLGRWGE